MEVNPGQWIVPPHKRKAKRYSYRGGSGNVTLLQAALTSRHFKGLNLEDRIKKSQLGPMYTSLLKFEYSSAVIYNTLVRSVQSEVVDEMLFRLGDTTCRFGRREFAMISGLSFKPLEEEEQGIIDTLTSSLLATTDLETGVITLTQTAPFVGPLSNVTRPILETALGRITNPDVMLKVGLIYLIDVAFHGKDTKDALSPFVFHMAEDIDLFLSYPWGTYFWELSLSNWKKRVQNLQKSCKAKKASKKPPNDNIYGLVSVLNAWVCETLPQHARSEFAVPLNVHIPRVLRWNNKDTRHFVKDTCKIFARVKKGARGFIHANDDEVSLLHESGFTDEQINSSPPTYTDPVDEEEPASSDKDSSDSDPMDLEEHDPIDDASTHSHLPPVHARACPSTSSQAVPSQSRVTSSPSVEPVTMEGIRQVVRQILDEHMKKFDEKISGVDRKVDSLAKDLAEHRAENKKDLQAMKNEIKGAIGSFFHIYQSEVRRASFVHVMRVGGDMVNAPARDTSAVVEGTSRQDKRPAVEGDTTPAPPSKKHKPVKQKQPIAKPVKQKRPI